MKQSQLKDRQQAAMMLLKSSGAPDDGDGMQALSAMDESDQPTRADEKPCCPRCGKELVCPECGVLIDNEKGNEKGNEQNGQGGPGEP